MKESAPFLCCKKFPDSQSPGGYIVKGSINKSDNFRMMEEDILKLSFNLRKIFMKKTLFNGRKAIGAGERTSPGAFIIDVSVFKMSGEVILPVR
jgi:hypothetical protein